MATVIGAFGLLCLAAAAQSTPALPGISNLTHLTPEAGFVIAFYALFVLGCIGIIYLALTNPGSNQDNASPTIAPLTPNPQHSAPSSASPNLSSPSRNSVSLSSSSRVNIASFDLNSIASRPIPYLSFPQLEPYPVIPNLSFRLAPPPLASDYVPLRFAIMLDRLDRSYSSDIALPRDAFSHIAISDSNLLIHAGGAPLFALPRFSSVTLETPEGEQLPRIDRAV